MNTQIRNLTATSLLWVLGTASVHLASAGPSVTQASVAAAPAFASASDASDPTAAPIDVADVALVKKWGIRIESLRLTASGYMLDLRYQVVDARKAKPLFERKTKPVLRDEASGVQLAVPVPPKTGALRNSNDPKAGRSYFMFFANPGRFVKPGNRVTVTIGAFSVSGIPVDAEAASQGAGVP